MRDGGDCGAVLVGDVPIELGHRGAVMLGGRGDDLADVMAAHDVREDAALVGFSMGGGEVARYMSRHHGKGVSQAALISSVVPYVLRDDSNPSGVPAATFVEMDQGLRADRAHFFT